MPVDSGILMMTLTTRDSAKEVSNRTADADPEVWVVANGFQCLWSSALNFNERMGRTYLLKTQEDGQGGEDQKASTDKIRQCVRKTLEPGDCPENLRIAFDWIRQHTPDQGSNDDT